MRSSQRLSRRDMLKIGALGGASVAIPSRRVSSLMTPATHQHGAARSATIDWVAWSSGPVLTAAFNAIKAKYPKDFKNVSLNLSIRTGGDVGVAEQLRLEMAAKKNIPDIVQLNYAEVPEFAHAHALADLSSLTKPVWKELYRGTQVASSYKGQVVAAPWQPKSKLMFYRPDLLDQAGIQIDKIKTSTDVINAAKQYREHFPDRYLLNTGTTVSSDVGEMLSAYPGLSFADKSGKYRITNHHAFEQIFAYHKELYSSGAAYPVADLTADWPAAIKDGRLACFIGANWLKGFLPQYATGAQKGLWKAQKWPAKLFPGADQQYGSDEGASVWVVPEKAPNRRLAMELLHAMRFDRDGSIAVFNATGNVPILKSAQSRTMSALDNLAKPPTMSQSDYDALPQVFFGKEYYPLEFESYDWIRVFGYDPAFTREWTIFTGWYTHMINGSVSPSSALSNAQQDMESQIGNPNGGS